MSVIADWSWPRKAILGAALALVSLFYFWTATTTEWPARPQRSLGYFYVLLADAFLAGQTHLLLEPDPDLLALPDPYDPHVGNPPYKMHDAVLFDRKYYLYYGPTPAVILFAPFKALTGVDFAEPLAVAIFCSIGLFYAVLLLRFLCRTFLPETSFGLFLAGVAVLAFGNVAPFLLRRPIHYEVAIAGGYAFAFASMYYFAVGALGPRVRRGYLALGSLLLGLAGGARFPMLAAGLIGTVLAGYVLFARREEPLRERLLAGLDFAGPVAACILLLGAYNFARFGSFTEFGIRYTLQGWESARTYEFYSLERLPAGLFYYLLAPPRLTAEFPFIKLDPAMSLTPPPDFYLEPVAGLLTHAPLVAILVFAPVALFRFRRPLLGLYLVAGASLIIGIVLMVLFSAAAGTMRYEVDFATYLLIPALLLWYGLINGLRESPIRRRIVVATFALLVTVTVVANTAFSIVGYYDNLKRGSPATYEAIRGAFGPLERWLGAGSQPHQ